MKNQKYLSICTESPQTSCELMVTVIQGTLTEGSPYTSDSAPRTYLLWTHWISPRWKRRGLFLSTWMREPRPEWRSDMPKLTSVAKPNSEREGLHSQAPCTMLVPWIPTEMEEMDMPVTVGQEPVPSKPSLCHAIHSALLPRKLFVLVNVSSALNYSFELPRLCWHLESS